MLAIRGKGRGEEDDYGVSSVQAVGVTKLALDLFEFIWNVEMYSVTSKTRDEIKSPIFTGGHTSNNSWQIKLNSKNKCDDGLEYVSLKLLLVELGEPSFRRQREIKARFQISLLDANGQPGKQAGSPTMGTCYFKEMGYWGYEKFILCTDLLSTEYQFLEDDMLKLRCAIWVEGEVQHEIHAVTSIPPEHEIRQIGTNNLSRDLGRVFQETILTDTEIFVSSGKSYRVHKAILAGRSSVFKAMFASNFFENRPVEIQDFDDDVVKSMLEYIYTGTIDTKALNDNAPALLQISQKFDLVELKEICEYTIASNLNIKYAANFLLMANLYEANILKPKVIEFMKQNKTEVKKTASCMDVSRSHPHVFVDLF